MTAEGGPLLKLAHPEGPRFLFEDEWVVFNPLSWEVHILNAAASAIYQLLADAPRRLSEIESLLRELLVEAEQEQAAEHAQRVVRDLIALGLVTEGAPPVAHGRI